MTASWYLVLVPEGKLTAMLFSTLDTLPCYLGSEWLFRYWSALVFVLLVVVQAVTSSDTADAVYARFVGSHVGRTPISPRAAQPSR
jgi:hypothetical protein